MRGNPAGDTLALRLPSSRLCCRGGPAGIERTGTSISTEQQPQISEYCSDEEQRKLFGGPFRSPGVPQGELWFDHIPDGAVRWHNVSVRQNNTVTKHLGL